MIRHAAGLCSFTAQLDLSGAAAGLSGALCLSVHAAVGGIRAGTGLADNVRWYLMYDVKTVL